jgi:hypothetical protein
MADADDREFDALLKDHADVRAAYRAASAGDQPPASLDAAILAASRRAVNAGPASVERSRRFASRFAVPLSAAAVMVLATSLSFLVYEERGAPSAPEPSRAVRAPASEAATAGDADQVAAAPAPASAPIEMPPPIATRELKEPALRRVAPPASGSTSVGSAPAAALPAAAPSPPVMGRSEPAAEAPSVLRPGAGEEREAMAKRLEETTSERSALRNDARASLAQAESAQAAASGPEPDRAVQARQADRAARQVEARDDVVAELPSAASMPPEAPAVSAKRLASPARDRAMDGTAPPEARQKSAVSPEETPAAWIGRVRALMDAGRVDAARAEVARLRCRHPDVTLPADLPAPSAGAACPAPPAKEGSSDLR